MPTRPELVGTFGMVASTHWLASAVGMSVLERGGNAFDAAAATGFTLQVVEPHLNGPGGEVPMLVSAAGSPDVEVIAGQGCAPAAATIEHFAELGLDLVPGTGLLAACVPAAFDAWLTLLERHGTWPLADVLAPAVAYARDGFPVLPATSRTIAAVADMLAREWPSSAAVYLPDGRVPAPGTRLRNTALADTYERLGRLGIDGARQEFYRGFVADYVGRHSMTPVMDVSGRPHAGLLTADDMAAWHTPIEAPVWGEFGDFRIAKTVAWGQGPVLLQQLALLAGFDLAAATPTEFVHLTVESAKLAFADREAWYGDSADVPLDVLLSAAYADSRRALIADTASFELRPGAPGGRTPRLPSTGRGAAAIGDGVGEPTVQPQVDSRGRTRGDTCHVDVVDRHGNLISATPSGGWLQSSPVIAELGFCLGTRAQMFWLEPGLPNSLAPGKRPRTTLSPSLALRDGSPYLAFGTPGGDQQDQWQLPFLLRHALFGLDLQAAIDEPTWHTTHFPSSFYPREAYPGQVVIENRVGREVLDGLRERRHDVVAAEGWSLGRLSAVSRGEDGFLRAAANPRGAQGYAAGR